LNSQICGQALIAGEKGKRPKTGDGKKILMTLHALSQLLQLLPTGLAYIAWSLGWFIIFNCVIANPLYVYRTLQILSSYGLIIGPSIRRKIDPSV
jgi:hypothetical protein